jgi:protocatechuate 3,4-dioxygenase beta subunit
MRVPWLAAVCAGALLIGVEAAHEGPPGHPQIRDGAKPLPGAAALGGVVIADDPPGAPVRRAAVTISAGDGGPDRQTLTDEAGRFLFEPVPPGRYLVTASKPGWLKTYHGSDRPGLPPGIRVALVDGDRVDDLGVTLVRGGVIAGRIVDEQGRPMPRQYAGLLELRTIGDRRVLAQARSHFAIGNFERATDDRGEYRKFGLLPGTYAIVVRPTMTPGARLTTAEELRWAFQPPGERGPPPPSGAAVGYAPVYHPGTFDAAAAAQVVLRPGDERTGIDVVISYAPVARVGGVVMTMGGEPAAKAVVTLDPAEGMSVLEGSGRRVTADAQGQFAFASVPPGAFRLTARLAGGASPASPHLWGETHLTVAGQDYGDLSLTLGPAPAIAGRIVFEASALQPPRDPSAIRVQLIARETLLTMAAGIVASGGVHDAAVAADGTFSAQGLVPGVYIATATWPGMQTGPAGQGWWLKSVTASGRDVSDTGLEVRAGQTLAGTVLTFSDRAAALSGVVTDSAGRPAPEYFIFAFPADRARWTPTSRRIVPPVRPGTDGRYRMPGLPPGDYHLAVITGFEEGDVWDPAFLESLLASAIRVSVGEGEERVRDIRLAR